MRFKDFIREAAVDKHSHPVFTPIDLGTAARAVESMCSDALWMFKENKFIWRGDPTPRVMRSLNEHGFAVIDTSATERKSENTKNYYTEIFDNHPEMIKMGFPKRSRSFICSLEKSRANDYHGRNTGGEVFALIPFNDVRIGFVNKEDMWDIHVNLFGMDLDIDRVNTRFGRIKIEDTWDGIKEFDQMLQGKSVGYTRMLALHDEFPTAKITPENGFLDQVLKAYSPKETGMTAGTTANWTNKDPGGECWVGGECIAVNASMINALRGELK